MATIAEIEAKMAKAQAAGDEPAVKAFRDRLTILKAAPSEISRKIEKAKAAGDQSAVEALSAGLKIRNDWQEEQYASQGGSPVTPKYADKPGAYADEIAQFEAANPKLAGQFKPGDKLPKVGERIGYTGGGGKSGGVPLLVQEWQNIDTFGDTAAAMVKGPVAGMKAFAGGLTGGPSPSREFLANDPLTKGLPSPILTGLGAVGDLGGAGLSAVGAGMMGGIGLAAEAIPGQGKQDERKLAEDVAGMAMFAVPELAGASSVPARVAAAAPKAAPVARVVPKVADDVAAAERLGIPVYRTDVKPPQTFIGKAVQRMGESIPIAGTGGMRAKQEAARTQAVKDFVTEYAGPPEALEDVTRAVRTKHAADVERLSKQKNAVIDNVPGAVETPDAFAAIDAQIAKIKRGTKEVADQVIPILEQWKNDLVGKSLKEIELIRKQVGERFTALDGSAGRSTGEAAVSAIYGPLRNDMANFIKTKGRPGDLNKWADANKRLSDLIGEAGNTALKNVLRKGDATPETVRAMLFSSKASDLARLKNALPREGQASARMAIVQEAVKRSVNDANDLSGLSVQKFKTALEKLGPQARAFFDKGDLEAAEGLIKALDLTRRAGVAAVSPPTGVQALPYLMTMGLGSQFGMTTGVAVAGGIGAMARIYEATGVRSVLRSLAKQSNPKAESAILSKLEAALRNSGVPGTSMAAYNSNTAPRTLQNARN